MRFGHLRLQTNDINTNIGTIHKTTDQRYQHKHWDNTQDYRPKTSTQTLEQHTRLQTNDINTNIGTTYTTTDQRHQHKH